MKSPTNTRLALVLVSMMNRAVSLGQILSTRDKSNMDSISLIAFVG